MPWRLAFLVIVLALPIVFIICNIGNKSDISFGFKVIHDVPVFVTVFCSIIFGMICAFPFVLRIKPREKAKGNGNNEKSEDKEGEPDKKYYGID